MKDTAKIITTREIFEYWKECLTKVGTAWDTDTAYDMTDIVRSPVFEIHISGDYAIDDFADIWGEVSQLELPDKTHTKKVYQSRYRSWKKVKRIMSKLEKVYLDNRCDK